jgi:hypothetical protein
MTRLVSTSPVRAALIAAASIGATMLATVPAAEARHAHRLGLIIHVGGSHFGYNHRLHHHGRVILASGYGCGWLYRKAVRTGSHYWWDRYESCRYGY